jgi:hypothetical protein
MIHHTSNTWIYVGWETCPKYIRVPSNPWISTTSPCVTMDISYIKDRCIIQPIYYFDYLSIQGSVSFWISFGLAVWHKWYAISGYVLDQKHTKKKSKGYQTLGYQPLHPVTVDTTGEIWVDTGTRVSFVLSLLHALASWWELWGVSAVTAWDGVFAKASEVAVTAAVSLDIALWSLEIWEDTGVFKWETIEIRPFEFDNANGYYTYVHWCLKEYCACVWLGEQVSLCFRQ